MNACKQINVDEGKTEEGKLVIRRRSTQQGLGPWFLVTTIDDTNRYRCPIKHSISLRLPGVRIVLPSMDILFPGHCQWRTRVLVKTTDVNRY